jgi:hypothetical protein
MNFDNPLDFILAIGFLVFVFMFLYSDKRGF